MFHFFDVMLPTVLFEENKFILKLELVGFNPIFIFFINTTNIRPITNSIPPNPNIKKVKDIETISFNWAPIKVDNTNKINQVNSEYNKIVTKFCVLKKNNPNDIQNNKIKKSKNPNI